MKTRQTLVGSLVLLVDRSCLSVRSSEAALSQWLGVEHCLYQDEAGNGNGHMNYLAGPWKANQEAMKKEGVVLL